MKLRNKKTGEIVIASINTSCGEIVFRYHPLDNADDINFKKYRSISALNEEWEDYEEPKWLRDYWLIDTCGNVVKQEDDGLGAARREIGNYFKTEEEAEKAVQKLKALQRLKERFDFHITGWDVLDNQVIITTDCDFDYVRDRQDDGLWADLDLVFNGNLLIGGEE